RFECILKLNTDLAWEDVQEEVRLLVRTRSGGSGRPVVKTQGGTYRDPGVWTEEFVPGQTLDDLLEIIAREDGLARVTELWPFLISSCAALIVDFWRRGGHDLTLHEPSPNKLVLPAHDWLLGGRLVSVAHRTECRELTKVLESIRTGIVAPLAERYPDAGLEAGWPLLFSAALEVLGEDDGCRRLKEEAARLDPSDELWGAIRRFVSGVRRRGFLPLRLRVAARRYRRWAQLNTDATLEARAVTLDQIEDAYGLRDLDRERPGSRLQLFRHTVFRGSTRELATGLDELIAEILANPPPRAQLHRAVTRLRESAHPNEHEEFFLARMLYPHVNPRGRAVLVRQEDTAGGFDTGIAVEQQDGAGEVFRIRRPVNPGEIGALARVFRGAGIRRTPRLGQDDLLVVTDDRERIIGGIISRHLSETYVRLDWLALSRHRRGRGIGSRLVLDFLERMRAEGVRVVSTGFFRPGFFSNFGFGVDPRYAGLVKFLEPEPGEAPTAFKGPPEDADS
ncbi:MAG: GNAT family N-acetyltransferase, partial [Gemmatimonadetes bacterium]|nr:GNAT family N-acetyltransferase [Gemmatimonadota bacterium]